MAAPRRFQRRLGCLSVHDALRKLRVDFCQPFGALLSCRFGFSHTPFGTIESLLRLLPCRVGGLRGPLGCFGFLELTLQHLPRRTAVILAQRPHCCNGCIKLLHLVLPGGCRLLAFAASPRTRVRVKSGSRTSTWARRFTLAAMCASSPIISRPTGARPIRLLLCCWLSPRPFVPFVPILPLAIRISHAWPSRTVVSLQTRQCLGKAAMQPVLRTGATRPPVPRGLRYGAGADRRRAPNR